MNLKIIGTNHLMKKEEVEKLIEAENPEIIGIEICEFREAGILDQKDIQEKKEKSLLGKITNKIMKKAEEEGLDYGSDMKAALNYSIEKEIPRVLVDMPILKIKELLEKIPNKEKEGFQREIEDFEKESMSQEVDSEKVLLGMKKRYPIAFEFLINMRNLYIAKEILKTMNENPEKKLVVILGNGHVDSVTKLTTGRLI